MLELIFCIEIVKLTKFFILLDNLPLFCFYIDQTQFPLNNQEALPRLTKDPYIILDNGLAMVGGSYMEPNSDTSPKNGFFAKLFRYDFLLTFIVL